jgi:5-hydroxyisourate hydrolase
MGRLSTHVLDTHSGRPAAGVTVWLERIAGGRRDALGRFETDPDGRAAPLLEGAALEAGLYELHFHIGDYFRTAGIVQPEPPFLDVVTIRFGVADAAAHYHVPLLCTPWSYTTYRGS